MIKKIIGCADIHIRNYKRLDEYQEQLDKFVDYCKNYVKQYEKGEVCIVIAGDLFHSKTDISPECYLAVSKFLSQLDEITETIVIAGNHDFNASNHDREDPIAVVFEMSNFKQTRYLDRETNKKTDFVIDQNIVWCLYSSFDSMGQLDVDDMRKKYPDKTYVALFHGDVEKSETDLGYESEIGFNVKHFEGVDFGIFGHIHKRQCLNDSKLVFCGSLIQQDHGESLSNHGFVIWDVNDKTYEEIDIPNENYGFYTFQIGSIDDIDNDKEVLLNQ